MGRRCVVCTHPKRDEIESDLLMAHDSYVVIGKRHNLSGTTVWRHKTGCMAYSIAAHMKYSREALLEKAERLLEKAERDVDDGPTHGRAAMQNAAHNWVRWLDGIQLQEESRNQFSELDEACQDGDSKKMIRSVAKQVANGRISPRAGLEFAKIMEVAAKLEDRDRGEVGSMNAQFIKVLDALKNHPEARAAVLKALGDMGDEKDS